MDEFINQAFLVDEDSTPDRMLVFTKTKKQFFDGVAHTSN